MNKMDNVIDANTMATHRHLEEGPEDCAASRSSDRVIILVVLG